MHIISFFRCVADFDVPSSREDVDGDSMWNQWLVSELPTLFVDSLETFKVRTCLRSRWKHYYKSSSEANWWILHNSKTFCLMQAHPDFTVFDAVCNFLQFVPLEDEALDFFKTVASQIAQLLKGKSCLPSQPNSQGKGTMQIVLPHRRNGSWKQIDQETICKFVSVNSVYL